MVYTKYDYSENICLSLITVRRSLFLNSIFLGIKTGVRDQPLTFNSKVKSSGYTAATPRHVSFPFVLHFYYFKIVLSMDKNLILKEQMNSFKTFSRTI